MPSKILPCGCVLDWGEIGTKLFMCGMHQFQYNFWEGDEEEFVKMVATPTTDIKTRQDYEFDSAVLSDLK